jgi:uncharacterized SAM-binding protein YcdF (DUF218 family)
MSSLWRALKSGLILFGAAMAIILFTPVTVYWAGWLASPWMDPHGEVLVVLTGSQLRNGMLGESSYWRAYYTVLIYREGGVRKIFISGGSAPPLPPIAEEMRRYLIASGVPPEIITVESASLNTRGSAQNLSLLLTGEPGGKVLVTSDYHVYRSRRFFEKAGMALSVRPVADAGKRGSVLSGRWGAFCDLTEETSKIIYYWLQNKL